MVQVSLITVKSIYWAFQKFVKDEDVDEAAKTVVTYGGQKSSTSAQHLKEEGRNDSTSKNTKSRGAVAIVCSGAAHDSAKLTVKSVVFSAKSQPQSRY